MSYQPDFYDLLGLTPDATQDEIRHAYRIAALKLHPDSRAQKSQTDLFLQVQEAYDAISDPKKRAKYDQQLAEERKATHPILTKVTYSRAKLPLIEEPQLVYALLDFSTPKRVEADPSTPINISLVIDRSTSMQGERMDTVKIAAIELMRRLRTKDIFSIVVFSDRAEVLLSASREQDKSITETQIRMIHPAGGTEIFQGLEAGYIEIRRNASRAHINHIILLTDGRTYGDEDACLKLAEKAATQGIRITGLGIGDDWNDVFLDELTGRTGGTSFYISKASDIRDFLNGTFSSLQQVYAEQVTLKLESKNGVATTSAFRIQPDSAEIPITPLLRLGSVPKSSKLSILLEFIVPPIDADTIRLILVTGELQLVLPSEPSLIHQLPIKLTRLIGDSSETDMPPRQIFQALSQITLYRMQEKARQEVVDGKIEEASLRLQRLATQLFSMGEEKLAQTAMQEANRIQNTHVFSASGEKQIKYGTRSLLFLVRTQDEIS